VHLDLRVDANAPLGTLANIADITPGVPGLPLPAALGSDLPGPVAAAGTRVAGVKRARAVVKVLARRIRPNFTG
jgi:hypothetical protein